MKKNYKFLGSLLKFVKRSLKVLSGLVVVVIVFLFVKFLYYQIPYHNLQSDIENNLSELSGSGVNVALFKSDLTVTEKSYYHDVLGRAELDQSRRPAYIYLNVLRDLERITISPLREKIGALNNALWKIEEVQGSSNDTEVRRSQFKTLLLETKAALKALEEVS